MYKILSRLSKDFDLIVEWMQVSFLEININIKTLSAEPYYAKGQEISDANIPKRKQIF